MVRANDLRLMDEEELDDKLRELKTELFNLRFQHATGQLENPMRIKETRRDIARVCTVMTERQYNIHPEAFVEALEAPPRETIEEPDELIEEEELEEEEGEETEVLHESEDMLEEEVEEELKDL